RARNPGEIGLGLGLGLGLGRELRHHPAVGLRAGTLALAVLALGCSARPALPIVEPARAPEPPAAAAAPAVTATAAAPEPPSPDERELGQRVQRAYLARAAGSADEARAMFGDVVRRLARAGERPVPGLGAVTGYAVKGRKAAGLTTGAGT